MSYRLAVDLGTAFAAAAVVNGSDPAMVGLGNRTMQIPSVLFLADDGTFLVGESAERRGVIEPHRLVREFKRRFGDPVPLLIAGAPYSAENLMARLLRWVVASTSVRQGEPPVELMLTHPANWGPYKRELLDQVVSLAELPQARYCTEPEAAAVNYATRTRVDVGDRIVVYDLGGGTFDVCVLEKRADGFVVLGTPDGIEHLGGADIDEAITELVYRALGSRLDAMDPDDPELTVGLARLRRDCVDAKEALSSETDVVVPVALPGLNTTVRVNRGELETTMRPALQDTVAALRRTLGSAGVSPAELRGIVLVGGSSRIPLVGELLQREFPVPLSIDTHPKHDVALGAALLCRDGHTRRPLVQPRSAHASAPEAAPGPTPVAPEPLTVPSETTQVAPEAPALRSSPPAVPPRGPVGRRRRIALAAAVVLVLVVAGVVVTQLTTRSSGGPGLDSSSGAEVSGAGAQSEISATPTAAELLSHVPADYRNTCHEFSDDLRGAAVKLGCAPEDHAVGDVTHWQFASAEAYGKAVEDTFGRSQPSTCESGPGEGPYVLHTEGGRSRSGLLMCSDSDGVVTFISSTDQLWVITVTDTTADSGWGYAELRGSWNQYPLE